MILETLKSPIFIQEKSSFKKILADLISLWAIYLSWRDFKPIFMIDITIQHLID